MYVSTSGIGYFKFVPTLIVAAKWSPLSECKRRHWEQANSTMQSSTQLKHKQ